METTHKSVSTKGLYRTPKSKSRSDSVTRLRASSPVSGCSLLARCVFGNAGFIFRFNALPWALRGHVFGGTCKKKSPDPLR